ncbi:roadblock/LC7 domain-containing protein [Streptomyces anulatus]|uniref:roadblock/LC7 domain-containing protein n=1 Tax=Streptomyces anulatus TaxID=1892 RepID=UPI001C266B38|nr:roadblock/LC7 domain-containing protein [Streptomyces anulatus]
MSNPVRFQPSAVPLSQQNNYGEQAQRLLGATNALSVILSSQDGLLVGAHQGADRDDAERVAALATVLLTSAREMAQFFAATEGASKVRQMTMEREDGGFVILAHVGPGVTVAVFTGPRTDLSSAAYEIVKFAQWFAPGVADRAEA